MEKIDIYSDIGSFFDLRRGIITHLSRENGHPEFKWELFDPIYQKRKMDYFIREDLGITPEGYNERYARRTIDDWADENECYFYPTNLSSEILQIVRSIEYGSSHTIIMSSLTLSINIYPFDMSPALEQELLGTLRAAFKIPVDVKLINVPDSDITAPYLNSFDYVFRYDHLIRPTSKRWFETLGDLRKMGTKYIVPNLLAKNYSEESGSTLKTVSVEDHIRKCSGVLGGSVIFIPVDKKIYQFKDVL